MEERVGNTLPLSPLFCFCLVYVVVSAVEFALSRVARSAAWSTKAFRTGVGVQSKGVGNKVVEKDAGKKLSEKFARRWHDHLKKYKEGKNVPKGEIRKLAEEFVKEVK